MSADVLDRVTSARVGELYRYWLRKRGGRVMPARRDIDPADLKPLLRFILVADLHDPPLRVRYRLAGTAVVAGLGFDITGRWLHEIDLPGGADHWTAQYGALMRTKLPRFHRLRAEFQDGSAVYLEAAMLPLSSDGETVDKTIELVDYEPVLRLAESQRRAAVWIPESAHGSVAWERSPDSLPE